MRSRLAATVLLSIGVFIVVTLVVSVGVLWLSGDELRRPNGSDLRRGGSPYGPRCELVRTIEKRPGDKHERSRGGHDR